MIGEMFILLNCLCISFGAEFAVFSMFTMTMIIVAVINDNENKMQSLKRKDFYFS